MVKCTLCLVALGMPCAELKAKQELLTLTLLLNLAEVERAFEFVCAYVCEREKEIVRVRERLKSD